MRKFLVVATFVAGGLLLAAAAIVVPAALMVMPFAQNSGPWPTDAQMIAHWQAKRVTLDELVAMMRHDDGMKRIGKDWSEPPDAAGAGVSDERLALYRRLMADAGIQVVMHYGTQVELVHATIGISVSGGAKSFCHGLPSEYVDQVDGDLDQARAGRRGFHLQRRIEGDWWLQYDGT